MERTGKWLADDVHVSVTKMNKNNHNFDWKDLYIEMIRDQLNNTDLLLNTLQGPRKRANRLKRFYWRTSARIQETLYVLRYGIRD